MCACVCVCVCVLGDSRISDGEESKSLTDSKLQIKGFSSASLLAAEDILVKLNHAMRMSHTSSRRWAETPAAGGKLWTTLAAFPLGR